MTHQAPHVTPADDPLAPIVAQTFNGQAFGLQSGVVALLIPAPPGRVNDVTRPDALQRLLAAVDTPAVIVGQPAEGDPVVLGYRTEDAEVVSQRDSHEHPVGSVVTIPAHTRALLTIENGPFGRLAGRLADDATGTVESYSDSTGAAVRLTFPWDAVVAHVNPRAFASGQAQREQEPAPATNPPDERRTYADANHAVRQAAETQSIVDTAVSLSVARDAVLSAVDAITTAGMTRAEAWRRIDDEVHNAMEASA